MVFEMLDANHNGKLSSEEIVGFLRAQGDYETPAADIEMIIWAADQDGDGEMSWEENLAFGHAMEDSDDYLALNRREQRARQQFDQADTNGDGYLDLDEAYNQFSRMPDFRGMSKGDVERRIARFDDDKDGRISFQESLIQTINGAAFLNLATEEDRIIFERGDTDGDGYLTPHEYKEIIKSMVSPAEAEMIEAMYTDEMVYHELAYADTDKDGKWSWAEIDAAN